MSKTTESLPACQENIIVITIYVVKMGNPNILKIYLTQGLNSHQHNNCKG